MRSFKHSDQTELENFVRVCALHELNENAGKRFIVDDVEVAVFKINEKVFALSNICPHQHSALIYDGFIEDGCVVCPAHGWMFNLETGRMPANRNGLDSFPVIVSEENDVYVKVEKKELKW